MRKVLLVAIFSAFAGCASVPMESQELSDQAKQFNPPSEGNAGLYVYRNSVIGQALKKDIWVDGKCVGESASKVFFYEELPGNKQYTISTESEFSPNNLVLLLERGKNYFVRQYIRLGVFVGGANLEVVDPEVGKKEVSKLGMARKGTCSS